MKNLLAIGIACVLPAAIGLPREPRDRMDASEAFLAEPTTVLVIDDASPAAGCPQGTELTRMAFSFAVVGLRVKQLTAHTQKVVRAIGRHRARACWI